METPTPSRKTLSKNGVLRESEKESNKEVLRRFRKIKRTTSWWVLRQASPVSPVKSIQSYNNFKERIELKNMLYSLSRREALTILFLVFVPLGTLVLNTILHQEDDLFSSDLKFIEGDLSIQSFFLPEGKTVDLQLEFSEPGIKILVAETVFDDIGLVQIDPILTIYKKPDQVFRIVDDLGPFSLDSVVVLNIENNDEFFNYIAQISAISSEQSGNITFELFSIPQSNISPNISTLLRFDGPGGRNGGSASFKEGEIYLIFAYNTNSTHEDILNTAIYVRSPNGNVLATNFGTSTSDFSARLLFQAKETGDHILEIDSLQNDQIFYSTLSPTEINLSTNTEIEGNIFSAISQTYLFTLENDLEYEISLESSFLDEFTELVEKTLIRENVEIKIPRFPPSLTLRIENPLTSELLVQTQTELDYEFSLEGEIVVMNPVNISGTSFNFSSNLGTPLLMEIFPTNPEYYTENFTQLIGSFRISISSQSLDTSVDFLDLVDPNDPYSECENSPFEIVSAGCSSGIFLFCRNDIFPFENIFDAVVDQSIGVCRCLEYICQELPTIGSGADQIANISIAFDTILLITARVVWKTLHKTSWM
eukprot:snap_masked-scaffold_14-processed-gene-6.31-mRNA-1 protein AED:1.00 eAED:1.00 QI:0/0/0/0/1/1/10/0/593